MSYTLCLDEGEQHEVVLLALVLVHGRHGARHAEHGVAASLGQDVTDEVFLTVVGGDDGDAVRGVAQQSHVLEHSHHVLGLAQILITDKQGTREGENKGKSLSNSKDGRQILGTMKVTIILNLIIIIIIIIIMMASTW